MIIDPNNRLFDRVPDLFLSPYPADEAQATHAFKTLMDRARGDGQTTVGEDLLSQAGAKPGTRPRSSCGRPRRPSAATARRGLVEGRVDQPEERRDRGLLAEVPFASRPTPQLCSEPWRV
jgi:hypothetical protein